MRKVTMRVLDAGAAAKDSPAGDHNEDEDDYLEGSKHV